MTRPARLQIGLGLVLPAVLSKRPLVTLFRQRPAGLDVAEHGLRGAVAGLAHEPGFPAGARSEWPEDHSASRPAAAACLTIRATALSDSGRPVTRPVL